MNLQPPQQFPDSQWMFCWDEKKRESSTPLRGSLTLKEFDGEKAIALLDKGQAVRRWSSSNVTQKVTISSSKL